jgi:hypothetical protein
MTLPVSFNEPTSLLQRVAEDMEYTELLDTAAERADSTERLLYVAAFASSEYASTIGRVAKPFNPLLAETYEYARPDKGYRFFIEQVSHHPPVGAAYAESKKWDYYVSCITCLSESWLTGLRVNLQSSQSSTANRLILTRLEHGSCACVQHQQVGRKSFTPGRRSRRPSLASSPVTQWWIITVLWKFETTLLEKSVMWSSKLVGGKRRQPTRWLERFLTLRAGYDGH